MSGSDKTKLNGIATGAEVNVQSDWNQTTTSEDSFIRNKPSIPQATPDATAALKGKVELATDSETVTGTDSTRAVTPAGLKGAITTGTDWQATESAKGLMSSSDKTKLNKLPDATDLDVDAKIISTKTGASNGLTTQGLATDDSDRGKIRFGVVTADMTGLTTTHKVYYGGDLQSSVSSGDLLVWNHDSDRWDLIVNLPDAVALPQDGTSAELEAGTVAAKRSWAPSILKTAINNLIQAATIAWNRITVPDKIEEGSIETVTTESALRTAITNAATAGNPRFIRVSIAVGTTITDEESPANSYKNGDLVYVT